MAELTPLFPLLACDVPTVYSNKQSYYECLCYIGYKLNEAIEAINSFTEDYKNYTNDKIDELKQYVDSLNSDMKKYVDNLNEETNNKIDKEIAKLDEKIIALEKNISRQISELTNLIYKLNDNMKDYVDNEIESVYQFIKTYIPSHIIVMNPTRGYETDLNIALSDMWDDLRYYGLTCNEFDDLQMSCNRFESHYISAHDFDLYGKKILVKDQDLYMFDPISGDYSLIKDVVYHIVDYYHRDHAMTASSFDSAKHITYSGTYVALNTTNFDNSNITCLAIDTNGGQYFTA